MQSNVQPRDLFQEAGIAPNVMPTQGVGDPQDLFQAAGVTALPQDTSLLGRMVGSAPVQATLGAGDAMSRALSLGLLQPKYGAGTAYDIGQVGGTIGAYMLPGGALKGLAAGVEGLAPLSQLLEAGGGTGMLRRILGSTAFGAATSPDDRLKGAGMGALFGGAGEAVPLVTKGVGNVLSIFRPQQIVDAITDTVPKQLAKVGGESNALYNSVFDRTGNTNIYEPVGKVTAAEDIPGIYSHIDHAGINTHYDSDLQTLHNKFTDNPTFQNAHDLQSEIGAQLRDLDVLRVRQGALRMPERNEYSFLSSARDSLQSDMWEFLNKVDPDLANQYQAATSHFIGNVIPNRNASLIINKLGANPTSQKVATSFANAANQGKDIPEYLQPLLENLQTRIAAKSIGQKGAGMLMGGALASGTSLAGEAAGLGIGALLGTSVSKGISGLPLQAIGRGIGRAYTPISQSIIANLLNPPQG